jgi:phenylacetate-CoA ligase
MPGAGAVHPIKINATPESLSKTGLFLCSVHDAYASQEAGVIGVHCGHAAGGIHLISEAAVIEVLSEGGNLVNAGPGEMVVTNLTNWAMPFLRYRTGDAIRLEFKAECVCGQSGPMITGISGRDSVYFLFSGQRFNPSLLNPVFEALPIEQFQVIQFPNQSLLTRVVCGNGAVDKKILEETLKKGMENLIGDVDIAFEFVPRIGDQGKKIQRYLRQK